MAKKLLTYIKEQPEVWETVLRQRTVTFAGFERDTENIQIRRLIFIGSGSSYIASLIAAEFAARITGFACEVLTPAEVKRYCGTYDKETMLVIAASQSGKSISTMNAIRRFQDAGCLVAGMTADSLSPIAKMTDFHYLVPCGEESVGPKTKGMTGTVLSLELLVLQAALKEGKIEEEQLEQVLIEFEQGILAGAKNIKQCEQYFKSNITSFRQHKHAVIIADPESSLVARECALKLLETWYVPVYSYEVEEYTHGIQNTIKEGICNLFIVSEETNASVMERLVTYCESKGCANLVISTVKGLKTDAKLLVLEKGGASFTTPFEILPAFQYLSAFGAIDRGIHCDMPKFDDFYDFMETKSK